MTIKLCEVAGAISALCLILSLTVTLPACADLTKSTVEVKQTPVSSPEAAAVERPAEKPKEAAPAKASHGPAAKETKETKAAHNEEKDSAGQRSSGGSTGGHHRLKARVTATPVVTEENKIEQSLSTANQLMKQGNFAEASDIYHQTVNLDPKNVEALVGYGSALVKQTKLGGAMDQFEKALKLDPLSAHAHCGKATVLLTRAKFSPDSARDAKQALLSDVEKESKQAMEIDPTIAQAHYNLAEAYRMQGNNEQAVTQLLQTVHIDPKYTEAFCGLGEIAMAQDHLTESADYFKRAINVSANSPTAHYGLGRTYLKDRRFKEAASELTTAANLYPNSWQVHRDLAEAYGETDNSEGMVKELKEVIRIKPDNVQARLRLADAREATGELETSAGELRSALEKMPDNEDLRLALGWQTLRLGKTDEALKEYSDVLEKSPTSVNAARGLVRCYHTGSLQEMKGQPMSGKDYKKAGQLLEKALSSAPSNLELQYARSQLDALAGKEVNLDAVGKPKTNAEVTAYAEALLAQNKFKNADEQFHTLLSKAENNRQIYAVADVALLLRDLNAAEAGYNKANTVGSSQERAKRGLDLISKWRATAKDDYARAEALVKKKEVGKAIPLYRSSAYDDPAQPAARAGLARSLEQLRQPKASALREAASQYRAYLNLDNSLQERDRVRFVKHIQTLEARATKLEQIEKQPEKQQAKPANGRISPTAWIH